MRPAKSVCSGGKLKERIIFNPEPDLEDDRSIIHHLHCSEPQSNFKYLLSILFWYFSWSDSVRIYVNVACDISWREKMLKNEKNVAAGN